MFFVTIVVLLLEQRQAFPGSFFEFAGLANVLAEPHFFNPAEFEKIGSCQKSKKKGHAKIDGLGYGPGFRFSQRWQNTNEEALFENGVAP